MHRVERKNLLLSYLCKNSFHEMNHVLDFVNDYEISSTTARRDLKELQKEGIISMSYGGIYFLGLSNKACSIDLMHRNRNYDLKMIIANKANELIEPNDVLFVGSGSTCELFVSQITKPVKIVTNSLRILQLAKDNPNVQYHVLFGGKLRDKSQSFYGSFCEESLSLIQFAKVIISVSNVDEEGYVYKSNEEEGRVELAALARVQTKILLVDSTKFNSVGFFKFTSLPTFTNIVTDKPEVFQTITSPAKVI